MFFQRKVQVLVTKDCIRQNFVTNLPYNMYEPDGNATSTDTAFIVKSHICVMTYFLMCVRGRTIRKLRIFEEIKLGEVHFQKWKIYI